MGSFPHEKKKNLICSALPVGACSFTASVLDATPLVVVIHAVWLRANCVAFGRNWRRILVMMAGLNQLLSVVALSLTVLIRLEGHPVVWYVVPLFAGAKVWIILGSEEHVLTTIHAAKVLCMYCSCENYATVQFDE